MIISHHQGARGAAPRPRAVDGGGPAPAPLGVLDRAVHGQDSVWGRHAPPLTDRPVLG